MLANCPKSAEKDFLEFQKSKDPTKHVKADGANLIMTYLKLTKTIEVQVIQNLLAAKVDTKHKNNFGESALDYALCHHAPLPVIYMLLGAGSDPNSPSFQGNTPLVLCANYRCNFETVKALLDSKADLNCKL